MISSRFALARALFLLAGGALACATAPPAPEPARQPDVPGLAPLANSAPASAAASPAGEPPPAARAVSATNRGTSPENAPAAPAPHDQGCTGRVGTGAVRRSALSRTLDAGLGTWLRGVDVEPKIERGRFQGWLVRGIYAGDPCWADVDLRAGDVVNRINRHPIERPEQAQAVWTALRGTGEIVVDFLRAGQPRTLRFAVVDDGN